MELRQYAAIIWKWLWLIALATVLAGASAYITSKNMLPVYEASATLLINQARTPTRGSDYTDILTSERLARTYARLLEEWPVIEHTAQRLGYADPEALDKLGVDITVQPVRDTQLIELKVESFDPGVAARVANTLPAVFIEQNQTLQRERFASTRQDITTQMDLVESEINATQEAINRLESKSELTPNEQAELSQLRIKLQQYQTTYQALLGSLEQLRLTEVQTTDNVVIASPARPPEHPVRPRTLLNTLLAAIVGAMIALGVAFLIEYLDDTIKTPDDVRETLGLATLGAITRITSEKHSDKLITAFESKSPVAEAYRVLRTNIQFSSVDKPLRALLITSPNPTEGKSTTAANLAVVMAQAGHRVIVVDTDLRRPIMHRLFRLPNNVGLTTALLPNPPQVDGLLQATAVENLAVLTSGQLPPNPSELLGSERMRQLIEHLKSQADMIIFDSPPALAVADAAVLGSQVDGVVLVVDSGSTRRDLALRAVETLQKVGANLLGVALNRLTPRSGGYYYYYYYYYYSGEGYSEDGRQHRRSRKPSNRRKLFSRSKQPQE